METQVTKGEVNFNHTQWRMIEKMSTRIPSRASVFSIWSQDTYKHVTLETNVEEWSKNKGIL